MHLPSRISLLVTPSAFGRGAACALLASLALLTGLAPSALAQAPDATPASEQAPAPTPLDATPTSEETPAPESIDGAVDAPTGEAEAPSNEAPAGEAEAPSDEPSPLSDTELSNAALSDAELEALSEAMALDQATSSEARDAAAPATEEPAARRRIGAAIMSAIQPELALILDVAASYFSDTPMQTGAHDPQRTGFTFQQLEMSFQANVDPYFLFRANLVFSEFGVEVEEAYAQTTSLPGRLQIKAGQFLSSFGRLNATHPHSWSFLDQPLVNGRFFGGEGQRGLGAELSWLAPTPWYMELVGSIMHGEGACCARSFIGGADHPIGGMQDFLYLVALKNTFAFDSDWSLSWGLSGLLGPNATGYHNRTEVYGTDLYLRYRPVRSTNYTAFSLQVELMHRRRQVPDDVRADTGLYAQAVWNINRRWETGVRYEWMSGSPGDDLDPEWTGTRQRASLQGTFYPSHFSRLRLQTNYDAPTWRPRPIWSAMLGVEFVVGAHGAHEF